MPTNLDKHEHLSLGSLSQSLYANSTTTMQLDALEASVLQMRAVIDGSQSSEYGLTNETLRDVLLDTDRPEPPIGEQTELEKRAALLDEVIRGAVYMATQAELDQWEADRLAALAG